MSRIFVPTVFACAAMAAALAMASSPVLAAADAKSANPKPTSATLGGLDANKDGLISRDEAEAAQKRRFAHLDTNDDGVLTQREFIAGDINGALPEDATPLQRQRHAEQQAAWFDNIDKNHDGKIDSQEYLDATAPYFDRMDSNHDGSIDADELKAAFAKERPSGP